jgi:hypothetical protein
MADDFLISIPASIPSYYIVSLSEQKLVNTYSIEFTNSLNGSFTLKGSNDKITWTTLDSKLNLTFNNNVVYTYTISSPNYYQYYYFGFDYGFNSPSTNMDLNLYISPYSIIEGNITVLEKGDNYIYWLWNPANISRVMVDNEFINNPSSGYFIDNNLLPDTNHKITLSYNNGTNIYTDTKTNEDIWHFLINRIWFFIAFIMIALSPFVSRWLGIGGGIISMALFTNYLFTNEPYLAIFALVLGIIGFFASEFKVEKT